MELSEFLQYALNTRISGMEIRKCTLRQMYPGLSWDFYEHFASLSEFVDCGCDFVEGKCARIRKDTYYKACCCDECYSRVGFQRNINLGTADILADFFEPNKGFWRPDVGCALPRKYRSTVCLRYYCGHVAPKSEIEKQYCKVMFEIQWERFEPVPLGIDQTPFLLYMETKLKEEYKKRQKQSMH